MDTTGKKTVPQGLTSGEAGKLLETYGENSLRAHKRTHPIIVFLKKFDSPLLIILILVSLVSFFLGEHLNAVIIFAMVLIGAIVDFLNTYRSSRAVEKLAERVQTTSTVIRDGKETEIQARYIVPGDIVRLSAGRLIPADGVILEANDFFVNQSALTGESFPSEKCPGKGGGTHGRPSEQDDLVFMGTSVVTGFATIRIERTGKETEYGKIAEGASKEDGETEFERGIREFSVFVMRLNLLLVGFVLIANAIIGRGFIDSITFAVAIAIGLTPELLPVMLSVSLARGSIRMSKKSAIVKNLSSIQNFGSMDILCTDKTGTLTQDKIQVIRHIDGSGKESEEVFAFSYLNSIYHTGIKNPLDRAIQEHDRVDISAYSKLDEVPFDFTRRRDSLVVSKNGRKILVTKGAPESVIAISSSAKKEGVITPIDDAGRKELLSLYESLSAEGFRVLAIAAKYLSEDDYTYDVKDESDMIFLGLVAFLDPPKKDAMETIRGFEELGVSIKILTGDSDILTRKICSDIGIDVKGVALGKDIDGLSDVAIASLAEKTTIFARVTPEEKERIIQALRKDARHVVGYMGDGINDVTALKAADVGISVENGVPVAKDAADIILLEKSLTSLKDGIEEGRKTFQNTLKYIMMWLSSNFGNMFSMMGASIFLPFLPMTPQQILLNNFLYDSAQVGLPTDRVDHEDTRRPPRWNLGNIRRFMFIFGPISSLFDFATFGTLLYVFHLSEKQFQTGWFLESLATQVLVIYLIRTKKIPFFRSRPSLFLFGNTAIILLVGWGIALSPLGSIFGFERLPIPIFLAIIGIILAYLILVEIAKKLFHRIIAGESEYPVHA